MSHLKYYYPCVCRTRANDQLQGIWPRLGYVSGLLLASERCEEGGVGLDKCWWGDVDLLETLSTQQNTP